MNTTCAIHAQQGVEHYCIVDPESRLVEIHRLDEGRYRRLAVTGEGVQEFDLGACRIELDFSRIWPE